MIRVPRVREPAQFDARCRQRGKAWLRRHAAGRPTAYWSAFLPALRAGFDGRCGYGAMFEPVGTVDHYRSTDTHRELSYDWGNLRFSAAWINASKGTADDAVLDPYEVRDGWFEILLPSLQLRVSSSIPAAHRARAEYTLSRLHLRDDERVLRQRREWYALYESGDLTLDGLEKVAPLIASAVRKAQQPARRRRS